VKNWRPFFLSLVQLMTVVGKVLVGKVTILSTPTKWLETF